MYKMLLLFLLLLHMLGDFYFQSHKIAKKKKSEYTAVVYHCLQYAAVFCISLAFLWSRQALFTAAALIVFHWCVDSIKYLYMARAKKPASEFLVYCCDQLVHFLLILAAVFFLRSTAVQFAALPVVHSLFLALPVHPLTLLKWLCLITFVWKPAMLTVKQLLPKYKPNPDHHGTSQATISEFIGNPDNITIKLQLSQAKPSESTGDSIANAGALIGILERIIIALLLSVNQYAAIGLVLTAKSVARYEKLKEQSFAEYYLIGTLFSAMLVIAAYLFLFVIL